MHAKYFPDGKTVNFFVSVFCKTRQIAFRSPCKIITHFVSTSIMICQWNVFIDFSTLPSELFFRLDISSHLTLGTWDFSVSLSLSVSLSRARDQFVRIRLSNLAESRGLITSPCYRRLHLSRCYSPAEVIDEVSERESEHKYYSRYRNL